MSADSAFVKIISGGRSSSTVNREISAFLVVRLNEVNDLEAIF